MTKRRLIKREKKRKTEIYMNEEGGEGKVDS